MSGIEIYPQAAADAGCTAWTTEESSTSADKWWEKRYRGHYEVAGGCTFDHWEWTKHEVYTNSYYPEKSYSKDIPKGGEGYLSFRDNEFEQWDGGEYWSETITSVRAVFNVPVAKKTKITVKTSAEPDEGGTTSPASETREGAVGSSTTFTLTATPEDGYRFVRWEGSGETLKQRVASVELTFQDEDITAEYVAYFAPLGDILCNDSGLILYGSAGSPLYDDGDGDDDSS